MAATKKKSSGKFFTIEIPLWHHDLWVSVGQSDEEFKKSIGGRLKTSRTVSEEDLFTLYGNGKTIILADGSPECLRVKDFPKTPSSFKTLNHEIMHVVSRLLRRNGIVLCDESEEAFCYTFGFLTEEIFKKL